MKSFRERRNFVDARYEIEVPKFTGRNVPIAEIARAIGKDAQFVRIGLQQGILKFGIAIKVGSSSEYSYFYKTFGGGSITDGKKGCKNGTWKY